MAEKTDKPDVVISGISGRLPESNNLEEFKDNLYNGVDMVTTDDRRWEPGIFDLPKRNGKLRDLDKFDAAFFGIVPKLADNMDPQLRLLLEVTHEAIVDAGINPQSIRGSRTGVFVGCGSAEARKAWSCDPKTTSGYALLGGVLAMFANRVSYCYDFKGPSYQIDTGCSSSLLTLNHALVAIKNGQCDAAIVAGTNLLCDPTLSVQFNNLNMLSSDGKCKSFDGTGSGYVRSEAVVALYIQKTSDARRIYATVVHAANNSDGFKEKGITYPSGDMQTELLKQIYEECGVNPADVAYVEAHGTGTKAGDPEELSAIAEAFCNDQRKGPLLIGSTKSNMGHPEGASGLASVVKVLIAMEKGELPGNLHFETPNPDIPALVDGRLQVVSENIPFNGQYVGINSFGFGGTNVHVLLKSNSVKYYEDVHFAANICRLFTFSARTQEGLDQIASSVNGYQTDLSLQALIQENSNVPSSMYPHRGYKLLNCQTDTYKTKVSKTPSGPVWFVFSGMGSQWPSMGRDLLSIDPFKESVTQSDSILKPYGIELLKLIHESSTETFKCPLNSFVTIAAIQVALVDVLKCVGVQPDGIVGHSVGELGCAYADGGLTAKETVLAAYWRGRCILDANLPKGAMAAVGLTWEEAKKRCPKGVVPACHNTSDTVTVAGSKEAVHLFMEELQKEDIFVKEVDSSGIAFHSPDMKKAAPALQTALEQIITDKRKRTHRWISTSVPQSEWNSDVASCSSAEYHVNNLVSPVLFNEGLQHIPENAVIIEIGPHCLLQSVLKRALSNECVFTSLMKKYADNVKHLFCNLGELHLAGVTVYPMKLYPEVRYPVSSGTLMISPLVKWNHSQSWRIPLLENYLPGQSGNNKTVLIDTSPNSEDYFLLEHKIDGRSLLPASAIIVYTWQLFASMNDVPFNTMPVVFENIQFYEATLLPPSTTVKLHISVHPGTGMFEVRNNAGNVLASGTISAATEENVLEPVGTRQLHEPEVLENEDIPKLSHTSEDIYKDLKLKGYEYGPKFRNMASASNDGSCGYLKWPKNWIIFMDSMLHLFPFTSKYLCLPTRLVSVTIQPGLNTRMLQESGTGELFIENNRVEDSITVGGVHILGLHFTLAPRRKETTNHVLQEYAFVPYFTTVDIIEGQSYVKECMDCIRKLASCFHNTENSSGDLPLLENTLKNILESFERTEIATAQQQASLSAATFELANESKLFVQFLKSISAELENSSLAETSQLMSSKYAPIEANDVLLGCLKQPRILHSFLSTVIENKTTEGNTQGTIKIVEYGDGEFYKILLPWLQKQPKLETKYIVYRASGNCSDELYNLEEEGKISLCQCDEDSHPPPEVWSADLAIIDEIIFTDSLRERFNHISDTVRNGGFLLLHGATTNHMLAYAARILLRQPSPHTHDGSAKSAHLYCEANVKEEIETAGLKLVSHAASGLLHSMFFCRKLDATGNVQQSIKVDVSSLTPTWVDDVKYAHGKSTKMWLMSKTGCNGVVGLMTSLRREAGGHNIRCALIHDDENISEEEIRNQQQLDLTMNVYLDGSWGHFTALPLSQNDVNLCDTEHAYVSILTRSDLSSLNWIESPLKYFEPSVKNDSTLVHVYYASLNFRDVMLATGKLPQDAIPGQCRLDECLLGLEYAGTDSSGNRVMGIVHSKALATTVAAGPRFRWIIPKGWTMCEAATVPVAYCTAYYALEVRGKIESGDTVLIQSGSSAVGQAAIAIALHHGCTVYTTVGNRSKMEYLKNKFPQLQDNNFANSRDATFERHIKKMTRGHGCDIVLNSLADDKLKAGLRCVARHGRFLEIGKYDLAKNTSLGMALLLKSISIHGILLDALFEENCKEWKEVAACFSKGLSLGVVQPLQTTVFKKHEVEDAFRYTAQGKHIGKVVLQIKDETLQDGQCVNAKNQQMAGSVKAIRQTYFDPKKSYIVTGGLGGFGLELTKWIVDRGATNIILTSRSGITTGYQSRQIQLLNDHLNVNVKVSKNDISTEEKVEQLIVHAQTMGEVGGIFHLAAVLEDKTMDNHTFQSFQKVLQPKVLGTNYLDRITRKICAESLDWFVVFSSAVTVIGNEGQTNYGFANSYMERLCEQRNRDGLAGIAIQWGAIGDVGMIANTFGEMNLSILGTVPQSINSCLKSMDSLLLGSHAVVGSFVLDEKQLGQRNSQMARESLIESIAHVLGISDVAQVDKNTSFGELGLDSLMGVEIKQVIERVTDVVPTMKQIRALSFGDLLIFQSSNVWNIANKENKKTEESIYKDILPEITCIKMRSKDETYDGPALFLVHHFFGNLEKLDFLVRYLKCDVYGFQFTENAPTTSMMDLAKYYVQEMKVVQPAGPYVVAGYSYGATVAVAMTEVEPEIAAAILLDGSPNHYKAFANLLAKGCATESESQTYAMCAFAHYLLPEKLKLTEFDDLMAKQPNLKKRIEVFAKYVYQAGPHLNSSIEKLEKVGYITCNRHNMANMYQPPVDKSLKMPCILVKPSEQSHGLEHLEESYGLNKVYSSVTIKTAPGNHFNFQSTVETATIITEVLAGIKMDQFQ